jgi:hypothetical protein
MRRLSLAATLATVALSVTACAESDPSTIEAPTTQPTTSTSGPGATSTATAPASDVQTIEVSYANGAVSPRGYTAKVKLGAKIHLVVHSDVSDEVHVHTYDKKADVTGGVATIDFTADIPGLFEIELESHGYTLLQLQVG